MPDILQTLNFQDDVGLRKAFNEYENGVSIPTARRAALIVAAFVLGGTAMDWQVFPDHLQEFLLIRIFCSLILVGVFFVLGSWPVTRSLSWVSYGVSMPPIIAICLMIAVTGGEKSSYYAGLNLVLVGLALLWRWSFRSSLLMTLICLGSYYLTVFVTPGKLSMPHLANNSWFFLVTSFFVVVGNFFYERIRFNEFALRTKVEESRTLLEAQNKQLSELDEAKTHFFANISHELRTPLTIMLGITERLKLVLSRESHDPKVNEMTQMLEQNGLRLLKLIDDLLDLVRFDTGHADVNFQPTQMEPHLDGLLRSLRHLAEQDRVALIWKCEYDQERVMVDRDKFDKILLNLVINAIKFTPSRGLIEVIAVIEDGKLTLTVEDSGVGIAPDVLPRIFERFWQVDTSSTRKFQGAGIGLSLVRSLTQAMGGEIDVESRVGVGTKFKISLPALTAPPLEELQVEEAPLKHGNMIADLHRRAAMAIPGKMQSSQPGSPGVGGITPGMSGITPSIGPIATPSIGGRPNSARPLVLIADDEPDIRRFLRMQLEDVDVIEASDGAEAVELAKQRQPQLALLDQMMPEMDGVEACRRIRENHTTRGTAIIVLTARADEQTKLNALQAGANDFLTKPFSTAELGLRLSNQLGMARIRREMADINLELKAAIEQIKESEVAMVRNEKLSSLGRMSAGIIHEINNPLNYARAGLHA
ncbi:MAG TPA: response regulator, partial [Luteolibacter sp.]|nr:response regulator [Luteolibacter sp.]